MRIVPGLAIALVALFPFSTFAQPRRELRVGVPAIPPVLDPAGSLEGPLPFIARQVFDTLVRFRDASSDIEPALATQWAVSPDGLTWTFTLRGGVRFHDGTVLTASTVATNFDRQMFPDHPYHPDQNDSWPRLLRGLPGVVKEVRALGDRTLRIQLVQPYAPLLSALAHPAFSVVLPVPAEGAPTRLLGTGPYRIVDVAPGRIVLEGHQGCWAGPPKIQRIVLLEVGNDDQAEAALDSKMLDVWLPAQAPRRKLGASSIPGWRVGLLAMHTEKAPFSRKKVRQAVAAALHPALLATALEDLAVALQSFLPLGVWGHSPGPPVMAANPEGARRLLTESGFAQGITPTLLIREKSGGIDVERVAEAIRLALDPAGIAVAIRIEPPDVVRQMTRSGEHEMTLTEARVDGGDPHLFLYPLSTSEGATRGGNLLNLSFYRNPRLDDLLIRASQLGFRPERLRLYQRAQRLLADELPWIPLYVRLHWVVARPEVSNLRLHPSGFHRLDQVELGE